MMARRTFFVSLAILALLATTGVTQNAEQPKFFIAAPNVFRVGVDETVVVSLLGQDAAVDVTVRLSLRLPGSDLNFQEQNVIVHPGSSESTTLRVEAENLARNEGRFQHIVLGASSLTSTHPFAKEEEVLVILQSGFVFVQTDKPIYTPNQKVLTRVMSLDQNMLPSDRSLHVEVINPQGISVKRFRKDHATDGFLSDEFQFPPHPKFGIWSITTFYGPEFKLNSTVKFEVKEYVLPTFSVKLRLPKYILKGATSVDVEIDAQYVFGKPVIGRYLFKFGVVEDDGTVEHFTEERQGSLDRSTGRKTVTLTNLDSVFGANWFERFEGRRFHAEAIVYETATGFSEASEDQSAIFVPSPYKISKSRTVQYFKKSLTMHIKLDLTFANGDPAPGVPVTINAIATVSNDDGTTSEQQLNAAQLNGVANQDQTSNTDEYGRRNLGLSVPPNAVSINIHGFTADPNYEEENQANLLFEVDASESPNNQDNIVIIPRTEDTHRFTVGEGYGFFIQRIGEQGGVDIHYMYLTAGKIVSRGVLENTGNNPLLHTTITQEMVPRTRVIVYYITVGGHVVADSLVLDIQEKCGGEVSLKIFPVRRPPLLTSYKPNTQVTVQVNAPASSYVGLLAVDKAVYLLRNKDLLTRRKMFDRMKGYDMGCGPGGGQTTKQIFKDSGMTVLTNALLNVDRREEMECSDAARRRRRSVDIAASCLTLNFTACLAGKPNLMGRLQTRNWPCRRRFLILRQECPLISIEDMNIYEQCCRLAVSIIAIDGRTVDVIDVEQAAGGDIPVREDFRETWFFDMIHIPDVRVPVNYNISTPSSITEWKMTAVSISPLLGMCIDDSKEVTVFQSFFIQLHLPYSVVRLEQTEVVVTIFNYGFSAREVTVTFTAPEALCTSGLPGEPITRVLYVQNENAATTIFIVRPVEVGDFVIDITARSGNAQDAIRKTLRVVPQGVTKRVWRSQTLNPGRVMFQEENARTTEAPSEPEVLIGAGNSTHQGGLQIKRFHLSLPQHFIPATESCSVSIIGNLLGSISADPIGGLENLVRRPIGCGEQTMIYLAPTFFVYKYLQAVDSDTPDLETKVYNFLANGVNRELSYRHSDGSYAAFLRIPGSTWLTAFVVKVFSQISQLTKVEAGHVQGSMNWLIDNNQLDSGAFQESQDVYHREMIGAVKGEVSMTAYVLISLLESRDLLVPANEKMNGAIRKCVEYLEAQLPNIVKVYEKAIVGYALALAESGSAAQALENLRESEERDADSGAVHFDPNPQNYDGTNTPYWLTRRPSAISVETTAYALLAHMEMGNYDYSGRIAIWLSKQQNYDGGFVSTQDTVVALQALAKYSERPEFRDIDLDCNVHMDKDPSFNYMYHIDNSNARVQDEVDVTPAIGLPLTLRATGHGVAKANVELLYNTEESDVDTCPFQININATEVKDGSELQELNISVCARYKGEQESTHMSIIDVGLYSGFKAITKDLEELTNSSDWISSYEFSNRSVVFYLDKIPSDEDVCFTFRAKPDAVVGNIQPVPVHVYDYYDPDESCTLFYKPGEESSLLSTLCSENECVCSTRKCGLCAQRYTRAILESAACMSQEGFALRVLVESSQESGGHNIVNVTVEVPIKTGVDNVAGQEKRQLYVDAACTCPRFRNGKSYLLVGDFGLKFTRPNGQEGFKYIIDHQMKVEFWPQQRKSKNAAVYDKLLQFQNDMIMTGCRT